MKFKLILFVYFLLFFHVAFAQLQLTADTTSLEQRETWLKLLEFAHLNPIKKYKPTDAHHDITRLCRRYQFSRPHINWADTLLLYTLEQRSSYQDVLTPENRAGNYLFYKTPSGKYHVLFSTEIGGKTLYDKECANIFPYYSCKRDSLIKDYERLSEHLLPDTNNRAYSVDLLYEEIAFFYEFEAIDEWLWYPFIRHKIEPCGEDCGRIGGYDKVIEVVTPNEYPHLAELLSIILLITNDTDEMLVQIKPKE